ncbi:CAAX prenyl protease 2 isoform X2 [Ooceraea biroi]|uniref:CAAX prenyl protease 2 isoform X2 n=1 Tax=Ooceraea biroi TaxID=2015173 RepID=UPI000F07D6A7|nr:CAAX prenyl protease 2 isoform X2 [Ooceraea biroi]
MEAAAQPSYEQPHNCASAILSCLALSVVYVASLYVWSTPHNREHPSTIKKRFFSVFIMTFLSPAPLYFGLNEKVFQKASMWELLGLRWSGFIQAAVIPLLLTMILFLGPLSLQGFNGLWRLYTEPMYWLGSVRTLIWWRNQVVAPLSEEWTFRACMLPLLLQCFTPATAIFVCPLFFGVAHFHHVVGRVKMGMGIKHALFISCFQSAYTTLFGAYAAFLFAKTGGHRTFFPSTRSASLREELLTRACIFSRTLRSAVRRALLLQSHGLSRSLRDSGVQGPAEEGRAALPVRHRSGRLVLPADADDAPVAVQQQLVLD